jgi:hypothetical protein
VAPPKSALRRAIDEVLADGRWHTLNEVVRDERTLQARERPDVLYRAVERRRAAKTGYVERQRWMSSNRVVESGTRTQVRDILSSMVRTGAVEHEGDRYRHAD